MFYRLQSSYLLRGWKQTPWVLVKRPDNKVQNLSQVQFQTLMLCDGETDVALDELDDQMKKALQQCREEGWIKLCPQPQPLEEEQYYKYFNNRYVKSVFWSITGKCNFRCRHCYMDAPDGALGELSTEQALNLVDQMAECGVLSVDITGGEPFVRRDFWQLIDRILSYKMNIGMVYTNGWLLNESVLDEFERRGIKPEISISFDGVGWHDWMRGIPGAEEAALHALQLCQKREFSTSVQMCIHRGNKDSLPQTIEVLKAIGVNNIRVGNVSMTDLWRSHSDGNQMSEDEYIDAMIHYIPKYYQANCPIELKIGSVIYLQTDGSYIIAGGNYNGRQESLNGYLCGGARWNCYITPEGRLLPCMPMTSGPREVQELFPLIGDIGLKKGLDDSFYMQFVNRRVKDLLVANKECAACEYRLTCGGGCRASALLSGEHNLMGCDRSMCRLLKTGYQKRIQKVAEEARAAYERRKAEANA